VFQLPVLNGFKPRSWHRMLAAITFICACWHAQPAAEAGFACQHAMLACTYKQPIMLIPEVCTRHAAKFSDELSCQYLPVNTVSAHPSRRRKNSPIRAMCEDFLVVANASSLCYNYSKKLFSLNSSVMDDTYHTYKTSNDEI
jgi:hypothetical protein